MKIGFIGCGNMASAIISGILKKGLFTKEEILVSNRTQEGKERSEKKLGVEATLDNCRVVREASVVVLAVKPQFCKEVIEEVREEVRDDQLFISIAAGKSLEWLEKALGGAHRIIRLMPNTPAMVGEGMTSISPNERATETDVELVKRITESFGKSEIVPERLIDPVMSLSGSSPAYVYMLIEAMADAGVADGMPRRQAYQFAAQAVLGSAKMVLETGMHPGELKDMVCSPGGTTIEAVGVLEKAGFRSAIFEAMRACVEKGKKM